MTVIATSDESDNMHHDGHRYVERVIETLKKSRSTHKIRIRTHKQFRENKPYTYTKADFRAKGVFVRTRRLENTKPHEMRKTVYKAVYVRKRRTYVYKIISPKFLTTKTQNLK